MIDTIRICGNSLYYKFKADYTTYTVIKRKKGDLVVPSFQSENKKRDGVSIYRVFHNMAHGNVSVEFNPHKLIFGNNIYNYEQNFQVLDRFVHHIANHFFSGGHCYISRLDLGGVVDYGTPHLATTHIESLRGTRLSGARIATYKNQSYKTSVFYKSQNWSIKVYNKGAEMKLPDGLDKIHGMSLNSTLRYEKTYRFGEMKRLGMEAVPYFGIPINQFSTKPLLEDFYRVFQQWERQSIPYMTEARGVIGLLSVLDNAGLLSEVEATGVTSRWSTYRYRKEKQNRPELQTFVEFKDNVPDDLKRKWFTAHTFGLSNFL